MRTLACTVLAAASMVVVPLAAAQSDVPVVEMREFAFRPAIIRMQAGRPVALRLENRGQIAHQFETEALQGLALTVTDAQLLIEGSSFEILRLQPGASAAVRFTPRRKGRFQFVCTIEGHREAGMIGVLEVY